MEKPVRNLRTLADSVINGSLPKNAKKEIVDERLKECVRCDHFTKISRQCEVCWCFVDLKTKILTAECPMNKW